MLDKHQNKALLGKVNQDIICIYNNKLQIEINKNINKMNSYDIWLLSLSPGSYFRKPSTNPDKPR